MTQPKSDSATSAAKRTLSEESLRAIQPSDQVGEMVSAFFEIPVLVERSTGGRDEHRIALPGPRRGPLRRPRQAPGRPGGPQGVPGRWARGEGRVLPAKGPPAMDRPPPRPANLARSRRRPAGRERRRKGPAARLSRSPASRG